MVSLLNSHAPSSCEPRYDVIGRPATRSHANLGTKTGRLLEEETDEMEYGNQTNIM
jgi:hypothetical protein